MTHFSGKLHTKIGLVIIPVIMNTFQAPHFLKRFAMAMNRQQTMTTIRSTIYIPTDYRGKYDPNPMAHFLYIRTFIYKVAEMDFKRHYFDRKVTFL